MWQCDRGRHLSVSQSVILSAPVTSWCHWIHSTLHTQDTQIARDDRGRYFGLQIFVQRIPSQMGCRCSNNVLVCTNVLLWLVLRKLPPRPHYYCKIDERYWDLPHMCQSTRMSGQYFMSTLRLCQHHQVCVRFVSAFSHVLWINVVSSIIGWLQVWILLYYGPRFCWLSVWCWDERSIVTVDQSISVNISFIFIILSFYMLFTLGYYYCTCYYLWPGEQYIIFAGK